MPVSRKIQKRRMALLGHILRLDPNTPAQKAFQYYITSHKCPVGRPPLTWIALVTKDLTQTLKYQNIKTPLNRDSINRLTIIAKDKCAWRKEIVRNMGREL